jgi:dimethylamine/trimethylamine dehydrogenase
MQATFRAIKAEGGWAAVSTEYCSISPESDDTPRVSARLWDDEDVRNLAAMCDAVHMHGALAGVELWYGGDGIAQGLESRAVPRAPTQIASEAEHMMTPREMGADDIEEMLDIYVTAALRARDAGFDIVDVYASQNQLPLQFLSPRYNRRDDAYGGSFEHRARFWIECLQRIREAVGGDCAITSRFSMTSLGESEQEVAELMRLVELADDLVDFWNVNLGGMLDWELDIGPSRFFAAGHQRAWTGRLREHTDKPIVGVGRYTDPDAMLAAVSGGEIDIIGAARPSIADPFLPRKIAEGRPEDIRECIGCNICNARWGSSAPIICTQNATSGEEYRRGWHPERFDRAANCNENVLVVGAGPAGMECARVLAERGMAAVHLAEAERELGGAMRWIASLPGLSEWSRVVSYRRTQLEKAAAVEVLTSTRLGAEEVLDYGADLVVLATGSRWAADGLQGLTHEPIPGAHLSHVVTPERILIDGHEPGGERLVVYDADGYYMAASLAELLARRGHRVTLVTPFSTLAPYMARTGEAVRQHLLLDELDVELATDTVLTEISAGEVSTRHVYLPGRGATRQVDDVILVTQRVSDTALWEELHASEERLGTSGVRRIFRVGDCVAPRLVADAIFDGHRLAREIDGPDPAVPLPFIRERRLIGTASDADFARQLSPRPPPTFP